MHYCQSCDDPVAQVPDPAGVRCPRCDRVDDAAISPVCIVTGASGAGKTAIVAPLARALHGDAVVFDVDWLLDAARALAGTAPIAWPAFRSAWLSVAHGAAQGGYATVLLAPFIPGHLEDLAQREWIGPIDFLLLDCPDETRRRRLDARPNWRQQDVEEQLQFGQWLREHISDVVMTDGGSPAETAGAVADWVRSRL